MAHQFKKRFGQNFLNSPSMIQKIIQSINAQESQHLVEIGPGEGALTEHLIKQVKQLDVIEIDRDLFTTLDQKFSHFSHFNLHLTDALGFDYAKLNHLHGEKFRIVGNLPYNISTPLLFHLLNYNEMIEDMHFMLQKEVVDRICAMPGNRTYGRLSVMMQYYCETESLFEIDPQNFVPSPKVDSAIVRLRPFKPIKAKNEHLFAGIVKQAFSQKRKTLKNNLKDSFTEDELNSCNIPPSVRAEQLPLKAFVDLANFKEDLDQCQPT